MTLFHPRERLSDRPPAHSHDERDLPARFRRGLVLDSPTLNTPTLTTPTVTASALTYTPTWGAPTVAPSLGDGTISGAYWELGPVVWVQIELVMGSTTTFGTGNWTFSVPVTPSTNPDGLLVVHCRDNSPAQEYSGSGRLNATELTNLAVSTAAADGRVDATHPFTWTQDDSLWVSGFYFPA